MSTATRIAARPSSSSTVIPWPSATAATTTATTGSMSIRTAARVLRMTRTPLITHTLGSAAPNVPAQRMAAQATVDYSENITLGAYFRMWLNTTYGSTSTPS